MFMVAIFYIFLEHCVTCCSKIISCGEFFEHLEPIFHIGSEQQLVLIGRFFLKDQKITLSLLKYDLNLMYEIAQQKPCSKIVFLLQSVSVEKMYIRNYCANYLVKLLLLQYLDLFGFSLAGVPWDGCSEYEKELYCSNKIRLDQACPETRVHFFRYRLLLSYDMWSQHSDLHRSHLFTVSYKWKKVQ